MAKRHEHVIGTTVLGRPIEAVQFLPPGYAKPRPPALLIGGTHGDEAVTQLVLERLADELVERPPGRETWIVPCLNIDGTLAGTRNNANDVDLARNFATASGSPAARASDRRGAGGAAEDQPETRAVVTLIEQLGPQRIVTLHATYRRVTWAGAGEALAAELSARCGYPVHHAPGANPGSIEDKYGALPREVIVLQMPYLDVDEDAWTDCRSALRWSVDLPD
ncbi:MAG: M14 family zinc carboxypeptidase [Kofleriaceae bacterium]